jgi:hypothetical protein
MLKSVRVRINRRALVMACVLALAACNRPVEIHYSQVGACDAGPHRALVFFEIGRIDNTKSGKDFTFIPLWVRLDADMIDTAPWPGYESLTTEMMVGQNKAARKTQVASGTAVSVLKFMVFRRQTDDPDGSKGANNSAYFLGYEQQDPAGPSVFPVKDNATQTSWRDTSNCNDIAAPNQSCTGCHSSDVALHRERLFRESQAKSAPPAPLSKTAK